MKNKKSKIKILCPGGETGKLTALRWRRPQGLEGSNPSLGILGS